LGERFLKRFLQRALDEYSGQVPVTSIEIELQSLDQMFPYRERQNIDILLLDEANRIAVIIENKIGSAEHSGQLQRYRETVHRQYPGWKIIPIFLSPDGASPTDDDFIAFDYGAISEIVLSLAESRRTSLDPEVYGLLHHYVRLLRRYVVEDSEIADLCRQIYAKHQRAIDLILEHRPGDRETRNAFIEDLIAQTDTLIEDEHSKSGVRFLPQAWDLPELRHSRGWTATERILLFEFISRQKSLTLALVVGPGDPEVRNAVIEASRAAGHPFRPSTKPGPVWTQLYSEPILKERDFDRLSVEEKQDRIRRFWGQFTSVTLPATLTSLQLPGMSTVSQTLAPILPFDGVESAIPQIAGDNDFS
jgi:PD-(D/E)XK nuclease superfamily